MSKFNRFLSSILAIVMIVTSLPVNTFAVGAGASSLGVYTDLQRQPQVVAMETQQERSCTSLSPMRI